MLKAGAESMESESKDCGEPTTSRQGEDRVVDKYSGDTPAAPEASKRG